MSTIQLPTRETPVKASRVGPKILVLYSLPKVGKTSVLTELAQKTDCLILDTEGGTKTYDTVAVDIRSAQGIKDVVDSIKAEGSKRYAAGMRGDGVFPYKFLALDTLDKFEDFAEVAATEAYKAGPFNKMGKGDFDTKYTTILELPNGAGYYYLRSQVMDTISLLAGVCQYLILVVHVKEKILLDKNNMEVKVNDISLTGKLASMVCAEADGIGYMYRSKNELRISFQTYDGAIMGARQAYLAGKDMPFAWETLYPDVFPVKAI